MSQQVINIGTTANDGTGDPLRTAWQKTNENFAEIYVGKCPIAGPGSTQAFAVGAFTQTGNALLAQTSGNVLVGTTTDDGINKLQVNGTLSATTSGQFGQAVGQNVLIDSNSIQSKAGAAVSSLHLQYTGGNIFTNYNGGNFLIGTATDDGINKLQVNGGVSMTGKLTYAAGNVAITASSGPNGAPPAQVGGYIIISIAGIDRKIPYYQN